MILDMDQEIIEFLKNNSGTHFSKDIAKSIGHEPTDVAKKLFDLHRRGFVFKSKAEKGKNVYEFNPNAEIKNEEKPVEKSKPEIKQSPDAEENSIDKSFSELEQKLNKTWEVKDKENKIKVLNRLADLLDDSIADVLVSIRTDLSRA